SAAALLTVPPSIYFLAATLLIVYVVAVAFLWRFQERIVFQPPRVVRAGEVAAERVEYSASDDVSLFAYFVGQRDATSTVVIAFHGNADLARWQIPWAVRVAEETGACVMLPEYRGYDDVGGSPTYPDVARDTLSELAR